MIAERLEPREDDGVKDMGNPQSISGNGVDWGSCAPRKRITMTDGGQPIAEYERSGPGEWIVLRYCNQATERVPRFKAVERHDLQRWLSEQLN